MRICCGSTGAGAYSSPTPPRCFRSSPRRAHRPPPPLGAWLTATIGDQLRAERIPPDPLGVLDPDQVRIAKTASRHVLGVMNDMVQYAQAVVDTSGRLAACDLERLNHRLRRGLHQRDEHTVGPRGRTAALTQPNAGDVFRPTRNLGQQWARPGRRANTLGSATAEGPRFGGGVGDGSVKVAVVQRPPVLLDRDASVKVAVDAIAEVAAAGAGLAVFPEAFIPGYPIWIWNLRPGGDYELTSHIHTQLLANSIDLSTDELGPVQEAAARSGVVVVCGSMNAKARSATRRCTTRCSPSAATGRSSIGIASSSPPTRSGWSGVKAMRPACAWSTPASVVSAA